MPFVYMLRCGDGTLYTGSAKDVAARLAQHEKGRASRYTRSRPPVTLVYVRRVRTWSAALKEEYRIKQLPRVAKEALVAAGGPDVPSPHPGGRHVPAARRPASRSRRSRGVRAARGPAGGEGQGSA